MRFTALCLVLLVAVATADQASTRINELKKKIDEVADKEVDYVKVFENGDPFLNANSADDLIAAQKENMKLAAMTSLPPQEQEKVRLKAEEDADPALKTMRMALRHQNAMAAEQKAIHGDWVPPVDTVDDTATLIEYNAAETIAAQRLNQNNNAPWQPDMQKKLAMDKELLAEQTDPSLKTIRLASERMEKVEAVVSSKQAAEKPADNSTDAAAAKTETVLLAENEKTTTDETIPEGPRNPTDIIKEQMQNQQENIPWYPNMAVDRAAAEQDKLDTANPAAATIREATIRMQHLSTEQGGDYPALHYDAEHPWVPSKKL